MIEPEGGGWVWGLELERWGFAGAQREIAGRASACAQGSASSTTVAAR
jgi:hypothetical protein